MSSGSPQAANYTGQMGQNQGLQNQAIGQAQQAWGQPIGNGDQARQQASNAMYGQATSRLDPQWNLQQNQLNSQLASQGLDPTSQAAKSQQQQFSNARNDAYNQADFSSQVFGGNAAQQNQQMNINSQMEPLQAYQGLLGGQLGMQGQQYGEDANNAQMQQQMLAGLLGGGMQLAGSLGGAAIGA